MSQTDPTAPRYGRIRTFDRSWTIEDAASIQISKKSLGVLAAAPPAVLPSGAPAGPAAGMPDTSPSLQKRAVSGRYKSPGNGFQLELRVDVDGQHPMQHISGDLFQLTGETTTYFGSFIVPSPTISVTPEEVRLEGTGSFSWDATYPKVRVRIARAFITEPPGDATVRFLTMDEAAGNQFTCEFQSVYFRTIQHEQAIVQGIIPFVEYNTGAMPSGGPGRPLSVVRAYAEAGIEMQLTGVSNLITPPASGAPWTNAELHNAMVEHFSLWADAPEWAVWLLAATIHEMGPSLRGIMFDQMGKQRQGCAVFHNVLGGNLPDDQRRQLRTYVHELGHCFNLMHSWQKSYAVPPIPDRPNALSYMNYPQNYQPGGDPAYWAAFAFAFDEEELIHLRHGFRDNVIMGGNDFAFGAADIDPRVFANPIEENSGLDLRLEAAPSFAFGEPVVVELKLSATDIRGKRVHMHIHPNFGYVQIGIRGPSGQLRMYKPMIQHCVEEDILTLGAANLAIYDSAYIGYGKDGFYFDQPGIYQVRAFYNSIDGSHILSNVLKIRVSNPLTSEEDGIADLFFGEDQGMLFYLLGSDAVSLTSGNKAMETVLETYSSHRLATYARLVKGINAGREFKQIKPSTVAEQNAATIVHEMMAAQGFRSLPAKTIQTRPSDYKESRMHLNEVVKAAKANRILDNITLHMVMRNIAYTFKSEDNTAKAREAVQDIKDTFSQKEIKSAVLNTINQQADSILSE